MAKYVFSHISLSINHWLHWSIILAKHQNRTIVRNTVHDGNCRLEVVVGQTQLILPSENPNSVVQEKVHIQYIAWLWKRPLVTIIGPFGFEIWMLTHRFTIWWSSSVGLLISAVTKMRNTSSASTRWSLTWIIDMGILVDHRWSAKHYPHTPFPTSFHYEVKHTHTYVKYIRIWVKMLVLRHLTSKSVWKLHSNRLDNQSAFQHECPNVPVHNESYSRLMRVGFQLVSRMAVPNSFGMILMCSRNESLSIRCSSR